MKILIVSNSPWRSDNSFGNSFSNIFEGIPNIEISNIYCKYGKPQNNVASHYFQITEKSLIGNILKGSPSGKEVFAESENEQHQDGGETTFNKIKRHKNIPMYWARALVWKIGFWKSKELIKFVDDFKPDLLFIPVYYSHYLHDINSFILKRFNIPALGYVSDDVYTLKQFSFSPFFWIDRFILRPKMKKVFSWCKTVYVISEIQKNDYERIFNVPCKILTKCADFSEEPNLKSEYNNPLQFVFTGNIGTNRWKSLAMIANALQKLNENGTKAELRIYTATPLTENMKKALNIDGSSYIMGSVSSSEISKIQSEADILVHAEAFDLKSKLAVRQSFSTKIVDYLKAARPILAVGPHDVASIDHLIKNDCAIIGETEEELVAKLKAVIENPKKLTEIALKGYECGKKYHNKKTMNEMLKNDLEKCAKGE